MRSCAGTCLFLIVFSIKKISLTALVVTCVYLSLTQRPRARRQPASSVAPMAGRSQCLQRAWLGATGRVDAQRGAALFGVARQSTERGSHDRRPDTGHANGERRCEPRVRTTESKTLDERLPIDCSLYERNIWSCVRRPICGSFFVHK